MDITIFPWRGELSEAQAFAQLFDNPSRDVYRGMIRAAERNTWGRLPEIKVRLFKGPSPRDQGALLGGGRLPEIKVRFFLFFNIAIAFLRGRSICG